MHCKHLTEILQPFQVKFSNLREVNLTTYEHNQNAGSESCICLFMP